MYMQSRVPDQHDNYESEGLALAIGCPTNRPLVGLGIG